MLGVIPIVHLCNGMNSHVVNNKFLSHIQFESIAVVSEQEGLCDDLSSNPDRSFQAFLHMWHLPVTEVYCHTTLQSASGC
ncbi:uncharacterized [Tachysurus ichikawai]